MSVTFHVQSVSGLAQCFSCRTIVSFLIEGTKLADAEIPRCPACKSECEIDHDSLHVDVRMSTRRAE
jgi:hypothetical protein